MWRYYIHKQWFIFLWNFGIFRSLYKTEMLQYMLLSKLLKNNAFCKNLLMCNIAGHIDDDIDDNLMNVSFTVNLRLNFLNFYMFIIFIIHVYKYVLHTLNFDKYTLWINTYFSASFLVCSFILVSIILFVIWSIVLEVVHTKPHLILMNRTQLYDDIELLFQLELHYLWQF